MTDGLIVTLQITLCAVIVGIVLGFLVGMVRATHDRTGKMKILNAICSDLSYSDPGNTGGCSAYAHLLRYIRQARLY